MDKPLSLGLGTAEEVFDEFLEGERKLFILRETRVDFVCAVRDRRSNKHYTRAYAKRDEATDWIEVESDYGFCVAVNEVGVEALRGEGAGDVRLCLFLDGEAHLLSAPPLS